MHVGACGILGGTVASYLLGTTSLISSLGGLCKGGSCYLLIRRTLVKLESVDNRLLLFGLVLVRWRNDVVRLIILGGPGSGRSTQAEQLAQQLSVQVVSTGNVLRDAIAAETKIGKEIKDTVEKGELVSDEMMIAFIKLRLMRPDLSRGWILEGYPRTAFQAEELDFLLDGLNQALTYAISLEVDRETLCDRCLQRGRNDDTQEAIDRRIELYHELTIPMLEYYGLRGKLLKINGNLPIEHVTQEILRQIPIAAIDEDFDR